MGKCVPLRPPRVGCTFRKAPQRETTSHSKGKFRDAFFESLPIRKARPTLDASGHGTIDLSGLPSIKRRPPGRRGTKFIASSARKEGHLMWPSSCAGLFEILRKHPPCARPLGSRLRERRSQQLVEELRVALAAARLHALAHQKADDLLVAVTILLRLIGTVCQHLVHDRL